MSSKPLKHVKQQEDWCYNCKEQGHNISSCGSLSDVARLVLAVVKRTVKEQKKIKNVEDGKKVKQSRKAGGGDTEKPLRLPLVAPAHIRSGVISLYSESRHQTLNIYD